MTPQSDSGFDHLKHLLPQIERISFTDEDLAGVRLPKQFACGRDLLAGIDVDELLAVPIDNVFADYME